MNTFKIYKDYIDIDYYVYFTKAYFAFNAYLKHKYPNNNDKEQIQEIQANISILRKFEELIGEGKHFKNDLIALRDGIHHASIINNGKTIDLANVRVGKHEVKEIFNAKYKRVQHFIKAIDGEKFTFTVKNYLSNPFKYEDLEQNLEDADITPTQKAKVRGEITEFASQYIINLSEEMDKLNELEDFDNNEQGAIIKNVYQGYMAILYKLRNALFHSEVEPNEDVMKVYKFAYFTLRKIIHKIPTN